MANAQHPRASTKGKRFIGTGEGPKRRTCLTLPEELLEWAGEYGDRLGISMAAVVRMALESLQSQVEVQEKYDSRHHTS